MFSPKFPIHMSHRKKKKKKQPKRRIVPCCAWHGLYPGFAVGWNHGASSQPQFWLPDEVWGFITSLLKSKSCISSFTYCWATNLHQLFSDFNSLVCPDQDSSGLSKEKSLLERSTDCSLPSWPWYLTFLLLCVRCSDLLHPPIRPPLLIAISQHMWSPLWLLSSPTPANLPLTLLAARNLLWIARSWLMFVLPHSFPSSPRPLSISSSPRVSAFPAYLGAPPTPLKLTCQTNYVLISPGPKTSLPSLLSQAFCKCEPGCCPLFLKT